MPILHFKPPLLCDFSRTREFASYPSQLEMKDYCRHAVVFPGSEGSQNKMTG
jgi:hypothetical protein